MQLATEMKSIQELVAIQQARNQLENTAGDKQKASTYNFRWLSTMLWVGKHQKNNLDANEIGSTRPYHDGQKFTISKIRIRKLLERKTIANK